MEIASRHDLSHILGGAPPVPVPMETRARMIASAPSPQRRPASEINRAPVVFDDPPEDNPQEMFAPSKGETKAVGGLLSVLFDAEPLAAPPWKSSSTWVGFCGALAAFAVALETISPGLIGRDGALALLALCCGGFVYLILRRWSRPDIEVRLPRHRKGFAS